MLIPFISKHVDGNALRISCASDVIGPDEGIRNCRTGLDRSVAECIRSIPAPQVDGTLKRLWEFN